MTTDEASGGAAFERDARGHRYSWWMVSDPNPENYSWVLPGWTRLYEAGYCVSLVSGIDPTDLLRRLGASEFDQTVGWSALDCLVGVGSKEEERKYGTTIAAAHVAPTWTLLVESGSPGLAAGATAAPISKDGQVLSHYRGPGLRHRFQWFRNGHQELSFDPYSAWHRSGRSADEWVDLIAAAGLPVNESGSLPTSDVVTKAGFIVSAKLSGFHLTSAVFEKALFHVAGRPVQKLT